MNLLPFVILVLLVLALFSSSNFDRHITRSRERDIFVGYFQALRKARNHKETQAYNQAIYRTNAGKQSDDYYFRIDNLGTLNLSSLLDDAQKWPKLMEVAIAYVNQLYSQADFYPQEKGFTKKLLKSVITALKKDKETPLRELEIESPFLIPFQQMLKGTQAYDFQKEGYPPFETVFTFESREGPPMNFQEANLSFLTLLFGEGAMEEIKKREKENPRKKIQRGELETLLSHLDPKDLDLFAFEAQPPQRRSGKGKDKKTNLTVRVP